MTELVISIIVFISLASIYLSGRVVICTSLIDCNCNDSKIKYIVIIAVMT